MEPLRRSRVLRSARLLAHGARRAAKRLPRLSGTFAALGLLAGSFGYALALGGHGGTVVDQLASAVGLGIRDIEIRGLAALDRAAVVERLQVRGGDSLPRFDANAARDRLAALSGIAAVSVQKVYPGRIVVAVEERVPFALWQTDGAVKVVDQTGAIVLDRVDARFTALPLVVGNGAEKRAREATALVASQPGIESRIRAAVLVAQRRWNLVTTEGMEIRLPEREPGQALAQLAELQARTRILDRDLLAIDLRAPDRLFLRLSEAAGVARREALKAKAAKPKGTST